MPDASNDTAHPLAAALRLLRARGFGSLPRKGATRYFEGPLVCKDGIVRIRLAIRDWDFEISCCTLARQRSKAARPQQTGQQPKCVSLSRALASLGDAHYRGATGSLERAGRRRRCPGGDSDCWRYVARTHAGHCPARFGSNLHQNDGFDTSGPPTVKPFAGLLTSCGVHSVKSSFPGSMPVSRTSPRSPMARAFAASSTARSSRRGLS